MGPPFVKSCQAVATMTEDGQSPDSGFVPGFAKDFFTAIDASSFRGDANGSAQGAAR
jgi:hypothetical protein